MLWNYKFQIFASICFIQVVLFNILQCFARKIKKKDFLVILRKSRIAMNFYLFLLLCFPDFLKLSHPVNCPLTFLFSTFFLSWNFYAKRRHLTRNRNQRLVLFSTAFEVFQVEPPRWSRAGKGMMNFSFASLSAFGLFFGGREKIVNGISSLLTLTITFRSDNDAFIQLGAFSLRLQIESKLFAFRDCRFTLKSFLR